jgi:hypothetical protein
MLFAVCASSEARGASHVELACRVVSRRVLAHCQVYSVFGELQRGGKYVGQLSLKESQELLLRVRLELIGLASYLLLSSINLECTCDITAED